MFPSFCAQNNDELLANFKLKEGYQEISQIIALALIEKGNINIVDVRTKEEFEEGHIENAYSCSHDLIIKNQSLPFAFDKTKPLLLYCRTGRRASEVGPLLHQIGYKYVLNFGGINTWKYGLI